MFLQKRKHLVLSVAALLSLVLNSGNVNAKTTQENLPITPSIFMDKVMVNSPVASASPLEETEPSTPTLTSPILHSVMMAAEATPAPIKGEEELEQITPTPAPTIKEEPILEVPLPKEDLDLQPVTTFPPLHKVMEKLPEATEDEVKQVTSTPSVAMPKKEKVIKKEQMEEKLEKATSTPSVVVDKVIEEKATATPIPFSKKELPVATFPPLHQAMEELPATTASPLPKENNIFSEKKPQTEDLFSVGYVRVRNAQNNKEKFLLKPGEKVQFLEENKKTLQIKAKKGQGVVKKNLLVTSKKAAEQAVKKEVKIFKTTGYCPCYGCSEGYKDHTASGRRAQSNHTVAADTSVLPMYTEVYIEGLGRYTVEDVGGGVKGKHLDVFVKKHADCDSKNRYNAKVYVIKG